jgi:hypothetical protein
MRNIIYYYNIVKILEGYNPTPLVGTFLFPTTGRYIRGFRYF